MGEEKISNQNAELFQESSILEVHSSGGHITGLLLEQLWGGGVYLVQFFN
jgi:hypothetical protein